MDNDKRFSDPAFQDNPFYRTWMQTYLAWCRGLDDLVDASSLAPADASRARFGLGLLTDALAPTNTLLGNPAALRKFFDTGGASAARGLTHMLEDVATNHGMPSQVDKSAFKVGGNLACTPGSVVYRNEVLELIQYAPATPTVFKRPLLAIPPQINKFYVLDLAPGRSLLEFLVRSGVQTFVVSWRNPAAAQRDWGLDTYLAAVMEGIDAVRDITASDDLNVMGACSGGISTALLLRKLAAAHDARVHSATFMVTALDGGIESQLGLLATPAAIEAARLRSRQKGMLEGHELAQAFAWLRANDLVWPYWVNNYLLGEDPRAFDILYWNNDTTNLPARLHSDFLDLLGKTIDLSDVVLDSYVIAGVTDHITPWQSCYQTTQVVGGQSEFVLSSSGHVQSIINPPGNPKASFLLNAQPAKDADAWMAGAQQHAGSWWEHWRTWLTARSAGRKRASSRPGNRRYRASAPAPGTYVLQN
ncbi:MAG TPA: alpha/beta fold hydrolase [Chloroflexota bacterium]|jgi:polyhydroxyalkanoate synthase